MVEAAQKDPNLLLAIAFMATQDQRASVLGLVVKHLPDTWETLAGCGLLNWRGHRPRCERIGP